LEVDALFKSRHTFFALITIPIYQQRNRAANAEKAMLNDLFKPVIPKAKVLPPPPPKKKDIYSDDRDDDKGSTLRDAGFLFASGDVAQDVSHLQL
jgi:hypothetical protein